MSFLDLKASRSTKSYVKSSINRPAFSASGELVEHERDGQISAASEEGLYSSLPPSVEVRRSELSGRGIWTKLPIKAGMFRAQIFPLVLICSWTGSVIVVAKPYASALSSENLQIYCSSCFASSGSDGMKRCSKCRAAYYCDWVRFRPFSVNLNSTFFRLARITIGRSTNMSARLCSDGFRQLHQAIRYLLLMLSDALVECYGEGRRTDSTVSK